jgi:hypothetical protein
MTSHLFIIARGAPVNEIKRRLKLAEEFVKNVMPEMHDYVDCLDCPGIVDEKFIRKYANLFYELKEIGLDKLTAKYSGQLYFFVFGDCPHWIIEMLGQITQSHEVTVVYTRRNWGD